MTTPTRTTSVNRIDAVASTLPASVRDQVVFIGGTVLPLLVDVDARFDAPRPTKDVDAVTATVSYAQFRQMENELRAAHFRHAPSGPISRWLAPHGEVFDLSTAGDHPGGTGAVVAYESKDLADLAVLLVGRETLVAEAALAADEVREMIHRHARALLEARDLAGALRSHFRDRQPIPPDTPDRLANDA